VVTDRDLAANANRLIAGSAAAAAGGDEADGAERERSR